MYTELMMPAGITIALMGALIFLLVYVGKKFRGPVTPPKAEPAPPKMGSQPQKPRVWLGSAQDYRSGDTSFRVEKRQPKMAKHKPMGRPKIWLDECTNRSVAGRCTHQDAWVHYLRWCHEEERQHVPRQKFLNIIARELPPVPGERAFAGLVLRDEVAA